MLRAYGSHGDRLVELPIADSVLPAGAIWIDALDPTPEERASIEQSCGIALPRMQSSICAGSMWTFRVAR